MRRLLTAGAVVLAALNPIPVVVVASVVLMGAALTAVVIARAA